MRRFNPSLLLAALLLWPTAAPAQNSGFTPEQARALRWFTITVRHTKAADIVQEMSWSGPNANSFFVLPNGVEHIYADPKTNTLLVWATVDGFQETRNIVRFLDKGGYTFTPTLTFLPIPQGSDPIHWTDGPTQGLEVSLLPSLSGTAAFQAVTKSSAVTNSGGRAKRVKVDRFLLYSPIDLVVDTPRLHGDGSLTLDFSYGCWNGPPVKVSGIRRGDVLVVRGRQLSYATLIQVNY